MSVTINGRAVSDATISREMQHHPASSQQKAWETATRALAIRELLLQEAARLMIAPHSDPGECEDEALIRGLLEREVRVPEPDEESCRRYFENNREALRAPRIHDVSHILLFAPQEPLARERTECKARELIAQLNGDVSRFADFARRHSACPSREAGGRMGPLRPGQTVPEFERVLSRLTPGEIAPGPIETRYGYHIVYLESRRGGELYSFEEARSLVANYLRESLYRRAVLDYVRLLARRAHIEGIDLEGARMAPVQ